MNKRIGSSAVIVCAVLVGIALGVSGSSIYSANRQRPVRSSAYNPPYLQQTSSDISKVVTVKVWVDAKGRVEDYQVLSDAQSIRSVSAEMKKMLIFTTFHPATFMGKPTSGTATLVFSSAGVTASQ